tara:strand:+ start:382 stop:939 length:558 start_codon:yes stop_codon:yes gene_type:complete
MSKLEANTIDTVSGTTNLVIGSTNSSTVTFESGAATGHMNPSFQAYVSSDQTLSNDTETTIAWDAETFDTDSTFDTSNYRFTPSKAGKYFVYITCNIDASSGFYYASSEVKKNGSNISGARIVSIFENKSSSSYDIEGIFLEYHGIVEMNGSSDYLTATAYMAGGGSAGNVKGNRTIWGAYRIGS